MRSSTFENPVFDFYAFLLLNSVISIELMIDLTNVSLGLMFINTNVQNGSNSPQMEKNMFFFNKFIL